MRITFFEDKGITINEKRVVVILSVPVAPVRVFTNWKTGITGRWFVRTRTMALLA